MQAVHSHSTIAPGVPIHRNRGVLSALVGIIGFFCVGGVCVSWSNEGRSITAFVSLPSVALVVLAPLVVLCGVFGWAGVIDAWTWLFRKPTPGKTADDAATFFQLGAAFSLAAGFLATTVGLILTLRDLAAPRQAGLSMSFALLNQLYGMFLAVVYLAASAHVAKRHNGPAASLPVAQRAAGVAALLVIAGVLTAMIAFGMLMLSAAPSL